MRAPLNDAAVIDVDDLFKMPVLISGDKINKKGHAVQKFNICRWIWRDQYM